MEYKKILHNSDIKKLAMRSALLQSSYNYERMQGMGWTHAMLPALEKIYKDDKEGLANAMKDNSGFINTNPTAAAFLMGLIISLEEKKEDRNLTICEAKRVLKNNGIILGFAINYTASTLVGLLNGLIHKRPFFEMCKEELKTGIHNPPDDFPWLLAEAYYHKPEQLKEEFLNQELTHLNTYAVEGMAWLDKDYFANMLNDKKQKALLELIQITENDSYLLPFSPHMMIAVKKQLSYGK